MSKKSKNKINIKFCGGNSWDVTGSMTYIETPNRKILLECGLWQSTGSTLENWKINTKKFVAGIEAALEKGDVEAAKNLARNTRGPIASIYYQGLMRLDQGVDVVEKSVVSYGGVQAGYLEKGCSWITLFIAMSPSLGFMGTVIGMVQAFDKIQQVGDISPTVVAGGMKVALITTIFGLIVALVLQVFYNYILSKIEAITSQMEDSSITLLDIIMKYNLKYKK